MALVSEIKDCAINLTRIDGGHLPNLPNFSQMSQNMQIHRRRRSCPRTLRMLWEAIKTIRHQRQIPNRERIVKYITRKHEISERDVVAQLNFSVHDKLIRRTLTQGSRGSKVGLEQEGYRLPNKEVVLDSHDWYCWVCHKSGTVINCTTCFRVYHLHCLVQKEIAENFVCEVCNLIKKDQCDTSLSREELNLLLSFSCKRLLKILVVKKHKHEEITQKPIKDIHLSDQESDAESENETDLLLSNDDNWQSKYLVYRDIDLNKMVSLLQKNEYTCLESFKADAENLLHNTILMFGVNSVENKSVEYMVEECKRDVKEIRLCKDCFYQSNVKASEDWFCIPCNPPHEIVYAKVKGYCYWPAKVIKKDQNDNYDVRFFGGSYTRAILPSKCIRPITDDILKEVKQTNQWLRAYDEMNEHLKYSSSDRPVLHSLSRNISLKSIPAKIRKRSSKSASSDKISLSNSYSESKDPLNVGVSMENETSYATLLEKSLSPDNQEHSRHSVSHDNTLKRLSTNHRKRKCTSPSFDNIDPFKGYGENTSNTTRVQEREEGRITLEKPFLNVNKKKEEQIAKHGGKELEVKNSFNGLSNGHSAIKKHNKKARTSQVGPGGKDLSFDPNALQEAMAKLVYEDVDANFKEGSHEDINDTNIESTRQRKESKGIFNLNKKKEEPTEHDGKPLEVRNSLNGVSGHSAIKKHNKKARNSQVGSGGKDLSFDPNALQEAMAKLVYEDVDANFKEGSRQVINDTNIESMRQQKESNMLTNIIYEQIKNKEINDIKQKYKNELAAYKKKNTKLKNQVEIQKMKLEKLTVKVNLLEEELDNIKSNHEVEIMETKKHNWCKNCYSEAKHHCCNSTFYCSDECLQSHWQQHQDICIRKDPIFIYGT